MFCMRILWLLMCCCCISLAGEAGAGDWDSCSKALRNLETASGSARFLAFTTARKQRLAKDSQALAMRQHGFSDRVPVFRDEYQHHVDKMEAVLIKLQSAVFDAELACYTTLLSQTGKGKPNHGEKLLGSMCLKLKEHAKSIPPDQRLDFCKRIHFPGDCRKCLTARHSLLDE